MTEITEHQPQVTTAIDGIKREKNKNSTHHPVPQSILRTTYIHLAKKYFNSIVYQQNGNRLREFHWIAL